MDIGKAIKEIRKKRGYSQKELAKKCDISSNALCQIEINNTFPYKTTINKVCTTLDIPVSYLLFYCLTEDDIPEEKREVFRALIGLRELLIQ